MNRIEFPSTKIAIIYTAISAVIIWLILDQLRVRNALLATGLLVDIAGAIVLVVPDFPKVRRQLRFGEIYDIRENLRGSNLVRITKEKEKEHHQAIVNVLSREEYLTQTQAEKVESLCAHESYNEPRQFSASSRSPDGYYNDTIEIWEYSEIDNLLREYSDSFEGGIRRSGLLILLIGFSLQFLSSASV